MFVYGPYVWALSISMQFELIYYWWINLKLINLGLWLYRIW